MERIVLCAALPNEVRQLCRQLGIAVPVKRNRIVMQDVHDSVDLYVAVSGIGKERMKRLLESIPPEPISCWVSIGFAGGLVEGMEVGDCITGNSIVNEDGESTVAVPPESISLKEEERFLLCADEIAVNSEEKRAWRRRTGAVAIDMESLAVAEQAVRRGERFLFIRVISDSVNETLSPALSRCIDRDGFPSVTAAMKAILKNPRLLAVAIRMGMRSRFLSERLAEEVMKFLDTLTVNHG